MKYSITTLLSGVITLLVFIFGPVNLAWATDENVNYTYDQLDRLIGVEYVNRGSIQYTYDSAGDITNVTISKINILTLKDAMLSLQLIAGKTPSDAVTLTADTNGDGKVGMEDVLYLLQQLAN